MPLMFTKSEIRDFLEEQGFDVTDDQTLGRFVKDLKKVIQYENMRRRRRRLGHDADDTVLDSTDGRLNFTSTSDSSPVQTSGSSKGYEDKQPSEVKATRKISVRFVGSDTDDEERSSSTSFYDEEEAPLGEAEVSLLKDDYPPPASLTESAVPLTPLEGAKSKEERVRRKTSPPLSSSNKYIMKRYTAATSETGDSVIEETDVYLGPMKRQATEVSRKSRPSAPAPCKRTHRPRTAPGRTRPVVQPRSFGKGKHDEKQRSRPTSAKPRTLTRNHESGDSEPRSSDEIIYILKEIIGHGEDDTDSLGSDECEDAPKKTKKIPLPPANIARDPVLLYHWYKKNHWDVYSFPGEDRHMQLRWAQRAKTVGCHMMR